MSEFYDCSYCAALGFTNSTEKIEVKTAGKTFYTPGLLKKKVCKKCGGTGKVDWVQNVLMNDLLIEERKST